MAADNPTGFPIPEGFFSGGAGIGALKDGGDLRTLLNAFCAWIGARGIVDAPADLAAITAPQDGWMVVVRESAGVGTPPALYTYDLNTTSWKNLLSTGLPGSHASTHQHGGADTVATATPAANVIPKADGSGKLDAFITADAAAGTASLRTLSNTATTACAGNDARLADARTPTAHTHANGDLSGASATPGNDKVVIAGASAATIDTWGAAPTGAVGTVWVAAAPATIRAAIDRIATAVAGLLAPGGIP